jgi:hypothetical protein
MSIDSKKEPRFDLDLPTISAAAQAALDAAGLAAASCLPGI